MKTTITITIITSYCRCPSPSRRGRHLHGRETRTPAVRRDARLVRGRKPTSGETRPIGRPRAVGTGKDRERLRVRFLVGHKSTDGYREKRHVESPRKVRRKLRDDRVRGRWVQFQPFQQVIYIYNVYILDDPKGGYVQGRN